MKGILGRIPASDACLMRDPERLKSSYEEFVHEPMSATESSDGHEGLQLVLADSCEIGCDKSGVNGPFKWGSNVARSWCFPC